MGKKDDGKNKFFENKKRTILSAIILLLFVVGIFFVSAYVTGRNVREDVELQWVSHTEYWNNDSASTIIRLADYRGNAYDVDSCSVNILYPNKTTFVSEGEMIESNIDGNWYRADSLVGAPLGTYEQEVTCVRGSQTIVSSQSFHLNPALEEVNTVSQDLDSARTELENVNLTVHANVQETGESINVNIDTTETTLSSLMNSIGTGITEDISSTEASLSTQLNDAEISLSGDISNTEAAVLLELANVNGSINDLLNNVIQPELETKIEQEIAALMAQVSAVNISITGIVEDTGESINVNVDAAETSLTNLVNAAETGILSEIQGTEATLNSSLTNVQVSLTNSLADTENALSTQLTNVNGSVTNLLNNVIQPELESLMNSHYNDIMASVADVYTDTQWIVANTMDQTDRAAIDARFTSIDEDLSKVLDFCGEVVTNESTLCQEIWTIESAIETLRQEQQAHFDSLNATAYNNWQLLSGDINSGVNNILTQLNLIQEQNEEINATTHEILDEVQGEIRADIIS